MSAKAVGWALEQKLEPVPKLILVAIADCMNGETRKCCPSQRYIAAQASVSERTVRTYVAELEQKRLLRRIRRTSAEGHRMADGYELFLDQAANPAAWPTGNGASALPAVATAAQEPERTELILSEGGGFSSTLLDGTVTERREKSSARAVMKIDGKRVPAELVRRAEAAFEHYRSVTGRTRLRAYTGAGDPSEGLKRIAHRLVAYPDLTEEELRVIVDRSVANPPGWVSGPVPDVGDIFGPRAFDTALTNDGVRRRGGPAETTNGRLARELLAKKGMSL